VLDTPLPGAVGLPVLNALQQSSVHAIPVVFLTVAHDHQRLLNAFAAGAVACIRKPYDENEVLAHIRVHLSLKLTQDRLAHVAREREELMNLVAHDLKNPLASVLFASEMLALPDCKPERTPRYLQIIDDSTREALGYIRSYLHSQA
jgi:two-component system sensor histidine kinase/response regulator